MVAGQGGTGEQVLVEEDGFLGSVVALLDERNPQIAARMLTPLTQWRRYDTSRQELMRAQLERLAARPALSDDVREVVIRSLA